MGSWPILLLVATVGALQHASAQIPNEEAALRNRIAARERASSEVILITVWRKGPNGWLVVSQRALPARPASQRLEPPPDDR
jgi:sarcosine oxidase gamma subunit